MYGMSKKAVQANDRKLGFFFFPTNLTHADTHTKAICYIWDQQCDFHMDTLSKIQLEFKKNQEK